MDGRREKSTKKVSKEAMSSTEGGPNHTKSCSLRKLEKRVLMQKQTIFIICFI